MKRNRPEMRLPPPGIPTAGSRLPSRSRSHSRNRSRTRRTLPPVATLLAILLLVGLLLGVPLLLLTRPGPDGRPTATPTAPGATVAPIATPPADPVWSVTRPTTGLPGDASLVYTADGRPLLSFLEPDGPDAGRRAWYAYDAGAGILRRVPLVWREVPYGARRVEIGLFREDGVVRCLAYGREGTPRLFATPDGSAYYAAPQDGVFRFRLDPAYDGEGPPALEAIVPDRTDDGYDREALLAFQRADDWTLTWANRPRLDDTGAWLAYTSDRRGFLADGDVHADLRQVGLPGGTDRVVAEDARPVAFAGGVLVYEKRDRRLYLRGLNAPGGPAAAPEVRWTGVLDQYEMFGPWLVYTTADGGTRHFFGRCPAAADGGSVLRSVSCAAKGRIANLYRPSPDGDTLGLVWLADRAKVSSARLVLLSLSRGTVRPYDLKAALSAGAGAEGGAAASPVDSFSFEGFVSDDAVLVAAVRAGREPEMRIVDLARLAPMAAQEDLAVREEPGG